MRRRMIAALVLTTLGIVTPAVARPRRTPPAAGVVLDLMTWPEVKAALAAGRTTALIYTGGTETRGPQNVTGGHTFMGRATVRAIAERLGNAIALPVLPFSPNLARPDLPGTLGIRYETLQAVLEDVTEQAITNGFRNVVLMGDHGGGQDPGGPAVYADVAKRLDAKYAARGIHVFYCDQVYQPANAEFDRQTVAKGYPRGIHAALSDTSEMLYLDPDGSWVRRELLPTAVGDPVGPDGKRIIGPDSPHNGITGDARRSSKALGKRQFDLKVDYAVRQIRGLIPDR